MPIITPDILLDDGKVMRNVLLFNDEIKEFDPMIAYLDGDYYYLYRGKLPIAVSGDHLEPGIYFDKQSDKYVLAVPSTEEEKKKYTYSDKICSTTASDIIDKGIDIDRFKYRFVDKNALFNFKQVLKGDNRLSMLLFDRGVEAFNLKYTIVLEENGNDSIGIPLNKPIIVSSNDTHELNGNAMKINMNDTGE